MDRREYRGKAESIQNNGQQEGGSATLQKRKTGYTKQEVAEEGGSATAQGGKALAIQNKWWERGIGLRLYREERQMLHKTKRDRGGRINDNTERNG